MGGSVQVKERGGWMGKRMLLWVQVDCCLLACSKECGGRLKECRWVWMGRMEGVERVR